MRRCAKRGLPSLIWAALLAGCVDIVVPGAPSGEIVIPPERESPPATYRTLPLTGTLEQEGSSEPLLVQSVLQLAGINQCGQIAATVGLKNAQVPTRAVLYTPRSDGTYVVHNIGAQWDRDIWHLADGLWSKSEARALNNRGQVVGWVTAGASERPFLYDPATRRVLDLSDARIYPVLVAPDDHVDQIASDGFNTLTRGRALSINDAGLIGGAVSWGRCTPPQAPCMGSGTTRAAVAWQLGRDGSGAPRVTSTKVLGTRDKDGVFFDALDVRLSAGGRALVPQAGESLLWSPSLGTPRPLPPALTPSLLVDRDGGAQVLIAGLDQAMAPAIFTLDGDQGDPMPQRLPWRGEQPIVVAQLQDLTSTGRSIVGTVTDSNLRRRGYLWSWVDGSYEVREISFVRAAYGINNAGQILADCGTADAAPCLLVPDAPQALPPCPSAATGGRR